MVVIENPEDYRFLGFEKSKSKNKKYDAILENKYTLREKRVPFGDKRYEHYKDRTDLKLYSHLDHNDSERRRNYTSRHSSDSQNKFSSGWFAQKYLW